MKIGLITIYTVPNYGSVLQAFATQKVIENLGHECVILNYLYPNEWQYNHGVKRPSVVRRIIKILGLKPIHRKEKKLNTFRQRFFNLSRKYNSLKDLRNEHWDGYDAFIVGSDQVWNTNYLKGDKTFLLSFVPNSIPRISFSSSFAQSKIPQEYVSVYKDELLKYHALSVREQNGVNILNNQLGINKPVQICLDPSLLLSKEKWLNIVPRSSFKSKRPYILVYMLKYAFDPQPYFWDVVKHFKKKMDADVIVLMGNESHAGITMIDATDSSIPKFIDLFANAAIVITSSFHGTAFAINFGRPLVSIVPNNDSDDRQLNLLRNVGAETCAVRKGTNIDSIKYEYDKEKVNKQLSALRVESINWLKNNLQA